MDMFIYFPSADGNSSADFAKNRLSNFGDEGERSRKFIAPVQNKGKVGEAV